MISVISLKLGKHTDFHLSFFQMVVEWWDFAVVTKLIRHFHSLYGFWGHCLNIRYVSMDLEPCFKVKLGEMTTLNVIFHVVVSDYRLIKLWTSPQFPAETYLDSQWYSAYLLSGNVMADGRNLLWEIAVGIREIICLFYKAHNTWLGSEIGWWVFLSQCHNLKR